MRAWGVVVSRARGRVKAATPRTIPGDVAALIECGHLPQAGVQVRVRYPGTKPYMQGVVDGYVHVDGALHVRIARSERGEDGQVRAIRRLIAWHTIESVSWDVPPTPRDVLLARPRETAEAVEVEVEVAVDASRVVSA